MFEVERYVRLLVFGASGIISRRDAESSSALNDITSIMSTNIIIRYAEGVRVSYEVHHMADEFLQTSLLSHLPDDTSSQDE